MQNQTETDNTGLTQANEYALFQNSPNPFNPSTSISFSLPEAGNVSIKIFDMTGKEVESLVSGNYDAGRHSVTFDASTLSSGMYYYKMSSGNFVTMKKMMLIK